MSFRIVVTEIQNTTQEPNPAMPDGDDIERYRQTVYVLDLPKLIDVINAKPRKVRERKAKVTA